MKKKIEVEIVEETAEETVETPVTPEKTYKEELLELYAKLKELNVRSISDLEGLIARA